MCDNSNLKYKGKSIDGSVLNSAYDAMRYARHIFKELEDDQEHGLCIYMNSALEVIKHKVVSSGHVDHTAFDPRIVFRHAVLCGATTLCLFHNHNVQSPPRPSEPDIECTKLLVEGGKILSVHVIDHIIISRGGWYSFANNGKLNGGSYGKK